MPMTWTTLTGSRSTEGSIRNWANHSSIPSDTIVNEAEALIFQRLRVIGMMKVQDSTIAADLSEVDISALNFLSPKSFNFYGYNQQRVTFRQFETFELSRLYENEAPYALQAGTPDSYTTDRQSLYFNVQTDVIHYYRMWYYQKPTELSGSNDTNLLTTDYPHILLSACLARAYKFRKDSAREDKHLAEFNAYIDMAMVESDMAFETAQFDMHWDIS